MVWTKTFGYQIWKWIETSLFYGKTLSMFNKEIQPLFSKFVENTRISVRNGTSIRFWTNGWVNGNCLCNLYSRLFSIISIRDESLVDVLIRKEEQFFWEFQFRRRLFIWEAEELDGMTTMLDALHINTSNYPYHLIWNACNSKDIFCIFNVQVFTLPSLNHWIIGEENLPLDLA